MQWVKGLKEEANKFKIVSLMKELLLANTQAAKTALLDKLEKLGQEPKACCKINREIDSLKFAEPDMTLDEWLNRIRRRSNDKLVIGVH